MMAEMCGGQHNKFRHQSDSFSKVSAVITELKNILHVQNAPQRKSQLLIISCCFSKSDTNFMQLVCANIYINVALRVWRRAL